MYSDGNHVVTYGSNYYKKINSDSVYEYLYLSNTFDHEMDSCDIGYLGEKLRSHIGDADLLSDISFLFCEMGVAFLPSQPMLTLSLQVLAPTGSIYTC